MKLTVSHERLYGTVSLFSCDAELLPAEQSNSGQPFRRRYRVNISYMNATLSVKFRDFRISVSGGSPDTRYCELGAADQTKGQCVSVELQRHLGGASEGLAQTYWEGQEFRASFRCCLPEPMSSLAHNTIVQVLGSQFSQSDVDFYPTDADGCLWRTSVLLSDDASPT